MSEGFIADASVGVLYAAFLLYLFLRLPNH